MSELNLIKTVLFNAANLDEALTRLTELGIAYRESTVFDGYVVIGHDVDFWKSSSVKCPLTVCINGQFQIYDDRLSFLACQPDPVPAASPEKKTAGERPTFTPCSTSISRLIKPDFVRKLVATEKRLKASTAEGYQL